jgi:rhodanese-related sulfurtransferase
VIVVKNCKFIPLKDLSPIIIFFITFLFLNLLFTTGTLHRAYSSNKGITPKESKKEQKELGNNYFTGKLKKRNPALTIAADSVLQQFKEKQDVILIDVRSSSEYNKFRIPGSIDIPLFAIKTKTFLKSKPLILINEGYSYSNLEQECLILRKSGFKASVLNGGLYQWKQKGGLLEGDVFAQRELNRILPQNFVTEKNYENWIVVDISQEESPEARYLFPGVSYIPYSNDSGQFISKFKSLVNKQTKGPFLSFLIYNAHGENYDKIEALLQKSEISNVFFLKGGLEAYKMLGSIRQDKDNQGRTRAVKTVKKCASCP